jgi:hypothetical protein
MGRSEEAMTQPKHPTPWHSVAHFVRDANNRDICRIEPPELAAQVVAAVNAQQTPQAEALPAKLDDGAEADCNRVAPSGGDFGALSPSVPGEAGEPTGDDLLEIWDSAQHRYVAQREPHDCPIEEFARRTLFEAGKAHAAERVKDLERKLGTANKANAVYKALLEKREFALTAESAERKRMEGRVAAAQRMREAYELWERTSRDCDEKVEAALELDAALDAFDKSSERETDGK